MAQDYDRIWMMEGLLKNEIPGVTEQATSFGKDLQSGNFIKLLQSVKCKEIFDHACEGEERSLSQKLLSCITMHVQGKQNIESELEVLSVGIAALQLFVKINWTGPQHEDTFSGGLGSPPWLQQSEEDHLRELVMDAEGVCPVLQGPQWLLLARAVLVKSLDHLIKLPIAAWWGIRCLLVHQAVLDEASCQLHAELRLLQDRLAVQLPWLALEESQQEQQEDSPPDQSASSPLKDVNSEAKQSESKKSSFPELDNLEHCQMRALFWIELSSARLWYSEVQKSKACLEQAMAALGLKVSLTGALGKRTRFQIRDLAQLTLRIAKFGGNSSEASLCLQQLLPEDLPKDVQLDDEVRLGKISFTAEEDEKLSALTPVEQSVLLASFVQTLKSQPKDAMAEEELLPYLNCILSQPQAWSLQLSALLARCKLEALHRRTVERSMTQAQVLVDCIGAERPSAVLRLGYIYASHMPPRWRVEAELASLLISLGAVNSALDVFLKLQMWEDVIACYHLLELRHKAAEIVRAELDKQPSAKLWCMLGDATDDFSCYEKAWELSNHRSARAQRFMGLYYFNRKEYEKCIPHLEKSIELNALQPSVLSRLAYSYLDQEDWRNCAKVYRQLCLLDGENFEAWNNLSKAYVKLGEKARAWKVLQESIKCNFENWRVWDNLMVVSIDCTEYQEAMRAYHRMLDLKGSHVDTEVLNILVKAVSENLMDNRGQPSGRLRKQALELFGRLTSMVTNNAKVWQLYGQLVGSDPQKTQQGMEKVVQLLQRAQQCAMLAPNWSREASSCQEAADISTSLAETCLKLCEQTGGVQAEKVRMLASSRLAMNSMIAKIKAEHLDAVSGELREELVPCVEQLKSKMEQVAAKTKQIQVASA